MRKRWACTVLALSACGLAHAAVAAFPDKPIRLVVPFAPGGGTDTIARALGAGMGKALKVSVIVDNKPGAGTIVGTDYVAQSAPDGYTIDMASFAHAVNPSLQPSLPYDYQTAFAPVALIGTGPNVMVVPADSPYHSVQDVIAAAQGKEKGKEKGLTYASQGIGTSAHLAGELFANLAKVPMTHVPYRGAGPAITDLLGNRIDVMFATAAAVSGFVQGGKLRALAVTSPRPSPAWPGVPTVAATLPGYSVESWYGLYVPAKTPQAVIQRLNAAAREATQSEDFRKRMEQEGLAVRTGDPAELDTYVRAEEARWRKVVKENNIKPE
ncbi:LacI family transcriptional regulator [Achromobacter aloeverae]|uniref:LacI family transcriptional regulator n=2 Tax=Achromobacter aloeverae TaxID=1750518 RepID=A0A4V1MRG3_9BURK|nr:tripartite tricarboxylate transporter substrate binding protein [Achromobacter aloeverae]RXN83837.1 LacI family transcriptional regulator [Achromobacter aloeverae]